MSEETRKILDMLHEGKIGVEEAEKLLAAVSPANPDRRRAGREHRGEEIPSHPGRAGPGIGR